jgi:4-amino-4-deoxy-L-arabinose transferase-like glycosyltransferase
LGLALKIAGPAKSWEIPFSHLVNFAVYVGALACFHFFLRSLLKAHRNAESKASCEGSDILPEWAWVSLGFALFTWTSLQMIHLVVLNPDLCVAAFVYLGGGLLLRIRIRPADWRIYLILGVVLGLGYWAKAPLFPMAFVFIFAGALAAGNLRIALPRLGVSLLLFLIVACPLILALSRAQGRLTFGDSAKLNYACYLYGIGGVNWQGQPPGTGTPKHPPRKLLDEPPVYAYATHLKGTYPPMYDPAYWEDGMRARFTLRGQARALLTDILEYFKLFVLRQGAILGAIVTLLVLSGTWRSGIRNLAEYAFLLIPPLAALCMYAPVHVEPRMVAGYVVLLWVGMLSGMRLPASPEFKKIAAAVMISMLVMLGVQIVGRVVEDLNNGISDAQQLNWVVAEELKRMGVAPGDIVASAGDTNNSSWHHIAEVSIVAETPDYGKESFWWAGDAQAKAQVFQAFATTGAKAVVADRMPFPNWSADWQRIGNTSYYVHFLTQPGG